MIQLMRTDASHEDFIKMVKELDAYLAVTDGDEHEFYSQFNKIDGIKYVIVAYDNGKACGCGAIKQIDTNTIEIKRMYTSPESRRRGIGSKILSALEIWAKELSYDRCVLETGLRQEAAVHFYRNNGYRQIPNYGQYKDVDNSLCFEKNIDEK